MRRPWKIKTTHQGVTTHSFRTTALRSYAKRLGGLTVTTLQGASRSFNPALPIWFFCQRFVIQTC